MPAKPERQRARSRRTTAHFLRRAFSVLAAESPDRYAELGRLLETAPGNYQVDGERFTVTVSGNQVAVAAGWRTAPVGVRVETTAEAVLQLVDGTASMEELLRREELAIWGKSDAILGLSAAVRTVAHAAIDSRGLQRQFERYRTWVMESRAGSQSQ